MPGKEVDASNERLIEAINNQLKGLEFHAKVTQENTVVARELVVKVGSLETRMDAMGEGFKAMGEQFEKVESKVSEIEQDAAFQRGQKAANDKQAPAWSETFRQNPWLLGMTICLLFIAFIAMLWISPKQTVEKIPVPRIESR